MSSLNQHIAIPKEVSTHDDLDYHFLREEGIKHLQELSGSLWTDFNSHDPGITILEMLCYAITDLGHRIEFPIVDLLDSKEIDKGITSQFYKAFEIFPTKPVTALDYRKLFIDLDGVKNCWLQAYEKTVYANCRAEDPDETLSYDKGEFGVVPEEFIKEFKLKGLYTILVDPEPNTELTFEAIEADIRESYHNNRNLCEDLIEVKPIGEQKVSVCAEIEIEPESDEELIKAKILHAIDQYFSPSLRFYALQELLDMGRTTDQIFEGPLLENGFIDTEELKAAELLSEVRVSDLIQIIMNIEGVLLIKDISIGNCDGSELENEWVICIDPDKKPIRCEESAFSFFKGILPLNINESMVEDYLEDLRQETEEQKALAKQDMRLTLPKGSMQTIDEYTSIQNDFPDTYGIGLEGIPGMVNTERRAKAKQLKAYLLFFEKILASYFKHLSKVKDLLSISGTETRTYFSQKIEDVAGFDELVTSEYPHDDELLTEALLTNFDDNIVRRNQILDHLLARFAERFGDYVFVMKTLYGTATDEQVLSHKETFLAEYPAISSQRGCGFNYYKQAPEALWNTHNVSGLQHRVSRLLGMKDYSRRNLHDSFLIITEDASAPGRYLWQIRDGVDATATVLLSSTSNYPNHSLAANAAFEAVLQLIQTSLENIETAFEGTVVNGTIVDNVILVKTAGQWSFEVLNDELPPSIVGSHDSFYPTEEDLMNAILETLDFAKNEFTEEGMFLVEHMLLRPDVTSGTGTHFMPVCTDNCESCDSLDPYSYRVSIVLPGYTYRFSNLDFRKYAEQVIKEELPSHVLPKICWVGHRKGEVPDDENDLLCFEEAWEAYLLAKTDLEQEQPAVELQNLIDALLKLNTIYPVGRLLDCDDEGDDTTGRIILGRSTLGTINTTEDDD